MRNPVLPRAALAAAWVAVCASTVDAQVPFERVGIRARGMGGAFVAVADDATATWWNPAGLATGAYFSADVEDGREQAPRVTHDLAGAPLAAVRTAGRGLAAAFPALGLSYYRVQVSEIRPATAAGEVGRQDHVGTGVGVRSLVLAQLGATVGQSLGEHLVIASTVKLVRGSAVAATRLPAEATFEAAAALNGSTSTRGDLDIGVLARFGAARLGLAVRNVTQPAFGSDTERMKLDRQARVGIAVTSGQRGATGAAVTAAADADLTRTTTAAGEERHVAGGLEVWLAGRRLGLRAGVGANTVGEARVSASVGGSMAVRSGLYLDGEVTRGGVRAPKSWGGGLRVTF